jgi:arylsulfatase A-like enzyme
VQAARPATGRPNIVFALTDDLSMNLLPVHADLQQPTSGDPCTYEAMRTHRFLYAEYDNGARELYDLRSDPYELDNIAGRLTPQGRSLLHDELTAIESCHDEQSCWNAMHVRETVEALRRDPRTHP